MNTDACALLQDVIRSLPHGPTRDKVKAAHDLFEQEANRLDLLGVHLSHCNFGENKNSCKYGDDDCPALSETWSWFGKCIQELDRLRDAPELRTAAVSLVMLKERMTILLDGTLADGNGELFAQLAKDYPAAWDALRTALGRKEMPEIWY